MAIIFREITYIWILDILKPYCSQETRVLRALISFQMVFIAAKTIFQRHEDVSKH